MFRIRSAKHACPNSPSKPPPLPRTQPGGAQPERAHRRHRRIATFLALALIGGFAGERVVRACTCFDPVVFDPANYAENVRQLAQIVSQVRQAEQAVTNGLRMAANWGYSQITGIEQAVQRVEDVLDDSGMYRTNPTEDLGRRYPTDYRPAPSREAFELLHAAWNDAERAALVENRRLQNEVVQDIALAASRIRGLVEASNRVEGETAAAQAHTELLAEASAELGKLQALKLSRTRLKVERQARRQSDAAYRETQREWVMRDWGDSTVAGSIDMPFGG